MKEKITFETFPVQAKAPKEYADWSKYQSDDARFPIKDPVRVSMESSLVLRQRIAYGYAEHVTHTILHRLSTIQWLPELWEEGSNKYHQFLLGTNNNVPGEYNYEKNHLVIFGFVAPDDVVHAPIDKTRIHKTEMKGFAPYRSPTVLKKIFVEQPLKLARYMPLDWTKIAVIGYNKCALHIFDLNKHPKVPKVSLKSGKLKPKPNTLLISTSPLNHFDWNPVKPGVILGATQGGDLEIWDMGSAKKTPVNQAEKELKPIQSISSQEEHGIVQAFWHPFQSDLIACFSEKSQFSFFDSRTNNEALHHFKPNPYVTGISLSPFHEHIFSTCSQDNSVRLWDLRNTKREMVSCVLGDSITQIQFSPHCPHMLAVATTDPSIVLLNLNKTGRLTPFDRRVEDGYAEVLFTHFQRQNIADFSWGPPEHPFRFGSVDNSIGFNLWSPSLKYLYENV